MLALDVPYAHREDVAAGAMEYAVRRGAQEEREPVTAMGSDNDEIRGLLFPNAVDFGFRSPKDKVLLIFRNGQRRAEFLQLALGLLMNLVLHAREIHGNIAAVGEAERFNHVEHAKPSPKSRGKRLGALTNTLRVFRQIDRKKQVGVVRHRVIPHRWAASSDDTMALPTSQGPRVDAKALKRVVKEIP